MKPVALVAAALLLSIAAYVYLQFYTLILDKYYLIQLLILLLVISSAITLAYLVVKSDPPYYTRAIPLILLSITAIASLGIVLESAYLNSLTTGYSYHTKILH